VKANEARGHKGDFIATVTRQDDKDIRLRNVLAEQLKTTLGQEQKYFHEAITLPTMSGDQLPTMRDIVDTSHFWMSDHTRFWYHIEGPILHNLGAVLISDTGKHSKGMNACDFQFLP
jgi:hypothetical protein